MRALPSARCRQYPGKKLEECTRKDRKRKGNVRHVVHAIAVQTEAILLVLSFHKEFNVLTDTDHRKCQRIGCKRQSTTQAALEDTKQKSTWDANRGASKSENENRRHRPSRADKVRNTKRRRMHALFHNLFEENLRFLLSKRTHGG